MSKRKATLELIKSRGTLTLYSLVFDDCEDSEFAKFMMKFNNSTITAIQKDFQEIISRINHMITRGAQINDFRPEGKFSDGVGALPMFTIKRKKEIGTLRLYCLRISDNILILGNGGIKTTDTYNENPTLNQFVKDLSSLDRSIKYHLAKKNITVTDNIITPESFIFYI